MFGKFRFEVQGRFSQNGEIFEKEAFEVAFGLFLLGWFKCRSNFAIGHLQGDVFALAYMRRWLEERHLSAEAGRVDSVSFPEENLGLSEIVYKRLVCVKDWRKFGTKKQHMMAMSN